MINVIKHYEQNYTFNNFILHIYYLITLYNVLICSIKYKNVSVRFYRDSLKIPTPWPTINQK